MGYLSREQSGLCHGKKPVCVWWLGLGAWYSTPMQMASQMVDIYTTGPWKVTSVETALSPWLVSHHQEHNNPISHYSGNILWNLLRDIRRNVWYCFRVNIIHHVGNPLLRWRWWCAGAPPSFFFFFLFSTWKCNPPKCKLHDFLKIFQTQHGLHFSWKHSWLMYFKWICNLNWSNKTLFGPPGRDGAPHWECSRPPEQLYLPHRDITGTC